MTRLVHAAAIILSCCHCGSCGWLLSATNLQKHALSMMRGGADTDDQASSAATITSEVVGAAGRMGSLFLRQDGSIAVPRGVSPGCLSPPSTRIYVATPSRSWRQVHSETIESRRTDLVWIGNGLVLPQFENSTVVVPHFGILSVGAAPVTSSSSPPTFVYGKHSKRVAEFLQREGIQTELVTSWNDIQIQAAQKLLWASCMWLLCHSLDPPLTVEQVHDQSKYILEDLVHELLPALEHIVGTNVDMNDTLAYLEAYSRSMPTVIPGKELAMDEMKERNGVWLQLKSRYQQKLHEELLLKAAGSEILDRVVEKPPFSTDDRHRVYLKDADLTVWGNSGSNTACRNAVVIGGGILGSSVALNVARRGINVTVLDRLGEHELGATTPASWAWINANNKSPPSYQRLNQLGMRAWRKDAIVVDLPIWNGALVQYEESPLFLGGYSVEGPLSIGRVQELEPHSNFSYSDGPVYFFADEGSVDPAAAVRSMRQAAKDLGVRFIPGQNVTALLRNEKGCITGVHSHSISSSPSNIVTIPADVVVVAAGIGSAAPAFGGLPLTHSPGQIAFARYLDSSSPCLKRILVDTVRESHVLQRQDGTLVAGGGFLEVGGTPSPSVIESRKQHADRGSELLDVALQLAPEPIGRSEFTNSAKAVRPMPKDGWPAVGYLEAGLYTVVSHSGVTLSPILGPLAAAEIADGVDLDILQPYRPARLFESS